MPIIDIPSLGVSFDTFFKKPVLARDAKLEEIANNSLEVFRAEGLTPAGIGFRPGGLFDYELSLRLFNGNATITLGSEKLRTEFRNARGAGDLKIISECAPKAFQLALSEIGITKFDVAAHVRLESVEEANAYLARDSKPEKGIVSKGTLAFVRTEKWPVPVYVTIEKSGSFEDGLFATFSTTFQDQLVTTESINRLGEAIIDCALRLDLEIKE